jgi:hypothetical protein
MSDAVPYNPDRPRSYSEWKDVYERRRRIISHAYAVALGGVGIFGAGDLGAKILVDLAPVFFAPIFVTSVLVSAAVLAYAYGKFDWEITCIERGLKGGSLNDANRVAKSCAARSAETAYKLATLLLMVPPSVLLVATWWARL